MREADSRVYKISYIAPKSLEVRSLSQVEHWEAIIVSVKLLIDCFGNEVRLTDERLAHICGHQEMSGLVTEIKQTVKNPKVVRHSRSDLTVKLFYDFCKETAVGSKWLCVVIKYTENDAFVITAYLTNQPKAGEDLWPTK